MLQKLTSFCLRKMTNNPNKLPVFATIAIFARLRGLEFISNEPFGILRKTKYALIANVEHNVPD